MANSQLPHPDSPKKPSRLRTASVLGALAGILLALLGSELVRAGTFHRWDKFAAPHPNLIEILWGDEQSVQVRVVQGPTVMWRPENAVWISSKTNTEPPRQPCSSVPAAFNPLAGAPFQRVNCAAFEYPRGDMIYTIIYALDKWGVIWQWERTRGSPDFLVLPFIALTGGFLGLLAAGIMDAIRNRRKSHAALVRPEEPSE
jgi:hypothetical protein